MRLSADEIQHLRTGAMFLACCPDPEWCDEQTARIVSYMARSGRSPDLVEVADLPADALVVSLGYVNNGLPLSDLRPVGDEFSTSLELVEDALGQKVSGIMPLAGANINALVPAMTALQLGIPVVDADPMGRVFPLLYQSVFTLAGLPAGPIGATGPNGESALLDVENPLRAERLVRALAGEFGGWSATALYPMTARLLHEHGILGSVSRMIRIGRVLNAAISVPEKHAELRRAEGVRRVIRARVSDTAGISRPAPPGQPDNPSTVVLIEESQGRIVQIEIQNELLLLLVDGDVIAAVPDIITMLRPEDGSVASLNDLWVGNQLDIVVLPAPAQWYAPAAVDLVGPAALHVWLQTRGRK